MRKSLAYIMAAMLLGCAHVAWAQEPDTLATPQADSTLAVVDSSAVSVLVQESLLPYKMQKRYRPVNRPFHNGGAMSNTYFTVIGAGYRQFDNNYSNGPYVSIAAGKWFSPYHGAELGVGMGSFVDNYTADRMLIIGVRASYLFNVSAYVDGYNPDRLVEFYPRAGLGGALLAKTKEGLSFGVSAHLGTDVNMRVFPGVDLVFQPLLELQKDGRGLARMDVWRGYLLALHLGVGARVTLDKERIGGDPGGRWFATVSGGIQLQNSDLRKDIAFGKAIGPIAAVGFGRYYGSFFALRLQGGYSYHYWKEIHEGDTDRYGQALQPDRFRSSYIFLRLEGALDFLPLFIKEYTGKMSTSLMLGPEVGWMTKRDPYYKDIRYPYVGFTTALQGKWWIVDHIALLWEPRVSIVPYSAFAFRTSTTNRNYYDAVMSMSLGLEYRF